MVALGSLARSLGASPELIKRLERAGVIVPLGRDRAGNVWVDTDVRRQVERVQSLMAAGYAEKDIALVIGRIERAPGRTRSDEVSSRAELAAAASIPPEVLTRWVADGLIAPWATVEGGEPLFERGLVQTACALAALEALGLGDHAQHFAELVRAGRGGVPGSGGQARSGDAIAALHKRIGERLGEVESAAQVLRKLLSQLGVAAVAKPRRRLQLRRKVRTARGDSTR